MRQFSTPHQAALAVLVVAVIALPAIVRSDRSDGSGNRRRARGGGRRTVILCRALALLIAAGWLGEYVADLAEGIWSVRYDLPLQLTDAVSVLSVFALWTRRRWAAELVFMWSLSASLQATITPDLSWNFPNTFYFTYFDYHVGAIVAGVTLVFGCGLYPAPRAALRAFAATLAWAALAAAGDIITGGNYMYLRAKPVHGSLLSVLGPWPLYIVATAAIGLVILLVLELIATAARRHDRLARASPPVSAAAEPVTQS